MAAWASAMGLGPLQSCRALSSESPTFDLVLCCCYFDILNHLCIQSPELFFCAGAYKLYSRSCWVGNSDPPSQGTASWGQRTVWLNSVRQSSMGEDGQRELAVTSCCRAEWNLLVLVASNIRALQLRGPYVPVGLEYFWFVPVVPMELLTMIPFTLRSLPVWTTNCMATLS